MFGNKIKELENENKALKEACINLQGCNQIQQGFISALNKLLVEQKTLLTIHEFAAVGFVVGILYLRAKKKG